MYEKKNNDFSWSGAFSVVGAGMLTNYLFLFGLILNGYIKNEWTYTWMGYDRWAYVYLSGL